MEEVGQFTVVVFVVERFGDEVARGLAAGKGPGTLVGGWRGLPERVRLRGAGVGVGGHSNGRRFVGKVSGEGRRGWAWVECCCCGHGGCLVYGIKRENAGKKGETKKKDMVDQAW